MYNTLSYSVHYNHNSWLIQQNVYVPRITQSIELPNKLKHKEVVLYKTESCRNWTELGHCRYGKKCRYAHGINELRKVPRHTRYKTQICRAYHMDGSCPYGIRCTFVHDSDYPSSSYDDEVSVSSSENEYYRQNQSMMKQQHIETIHYYNNPIHNMWM